MPLNHPIVFLLQNTHVPLWSVVLIGSSSLAVLHYVVEKEPPKTEQMPVVIAAFVMSVFWISTVAGELLNCLAALGSLLKLPPALLGLTVLAWGNSVGDLVADVVVAKAGQPAKAMAGCFAGPMFNMLFRLGTVLVIQTANVYPEAYELHFHVSIVIAFVFLYLSSEPGGFSLSSNSVQVLGAKVLGILPCRSLRSFYNSEPDHCKVLTVISDQIKGERELGSEKPSSYLVKGTSNADVVFI